MNNKRKRERQQFGEQEQQRALVRAFSRQATDNWQLIFHAPVTLTFQQERKHEIQVGRGKILYSIPASFRLVFGAANQGGCERGTTTSASNNYYDDDDDVGRDETCCVSRTILCGNPRWELRRRRKDTCRGCWWHRFMLLLFMLPRQLCLLGDKKSFSFSRSISLPLNTGKRREFSGLRERRSEIKGTNKHKSSSEWFSARAASSPPRNSWVPQSYLSSARLDWATKFARFHCNTIVCSANSNNKYKGTKPTGCSSFTFRRVPLSVMKAECRRASLLAIRNRRCFVLQLFEGNNNKSLPLSQDAFLNPVI